MEHENTVRPARRPRRVNGLDIADPLAWVCKMVGLPKIGNHYILYFNPSQNILLSVGPHWGGLVLMIWSRN